MRKKKKGGEGKKVERECGRYIHDSITHDGIVCHHEGKRHPVFFSKMVEQKDLKLNETLAMETCVLCVSVKRKKRF